MLSRSGIRMGFFTIGLYPSNILPVSVNDEKVASLKFIDGSSEFLYIELVDVVNLPKSLDGLLVYPLPQPL